MSGGTDLYPSWVGRPLPQRVVDGIRAALRGIRFDAEHIRIGGRTTWTDILHANLPPAFAGSRPPPAVGSVQIERRDRTA